MLIELVGQIEHITFTNEENGFTIAKVNVDGRPDLVTIVGNLMSPMPGEILHMQGEWTHHPKFGRQFKVAQFKTKIPATVEGIRKYLGSGLIKGLGPVMTGRIVDKFGEKTLDVIENQIDRLADVDGIGKKRIAVIAKAWDAQKDIRDVMLFLQTHGVSSGYAVKIFKRYGDRAIAIVRENPYRLAADIFGIGFRKADHVAAELGFGKNSSVRLEAGVLYVLQQLAEDGHVYYPYDPLIAKCREILDVEREYVTAALDTLGRQREITIEDLNHGTEKTIENNKAVYLSKYLACESGIAWLLKRLIKTPKPIREIDTAKAIQWVQQQLSITLAANQLEAVRCAIESKVMVITGGPGTGKTTIINAALKIFSRLGLQIMLAAPTGRAAKRMSEATRFDSKTIHRLLEYSLQKGGFQRNEDNPLNCQVLIVDEASMIDTVLMLYLLKAIPATATFILVGDVNQLPSVGAGNVLNDIISSGVAPVVRLNKIFRQAQASRIIVNAHKINAGIVPSLQPADQTDPRNDFYIIEQDDPDRVLEIIIELAQTRIPQRFGLNPLTEIQVLTPMHKGVVGAGNLNLQLQAALNPGDEGIIRGERMYRLNDKVMQIRNNYDKDVFNGDIGRIAQIRPAEREVVVDFDGRKIPYDFSDLDEIILAYAVSVHKSQGSEYPAVIIPVLTQHYILLQRNLIYTAVTRGRKLVVMVGSRKALAIGVKSQKTAHRYTRLRERLIWEN